MDVNIFLLHNRLLYPFSLPLSFIDILINKIRWRLCIFRGGKRGILQKEYKNTHDWLTLSSKALTFTD